jgi:hypothetical protein
MVTKMTLAEYRTEQAEKNMSVGEKVTRLNGRNEHLNSHAWTDEQLLAIPEDLVQFAYEHSEALRKEFSSLTTFQAYRRAMKNGSARIVAVR